MPRKRRKNVDKKKVMTTIGKALLQKVLQGIRVPSILIIVGVLIVFSELDLFGDSILASLPALSYGTLFFGMVITAAFNRSRAFFILLILTLGEWAFTLHSTYALISLLVPLNFAFFSVAAERGILSARGKKYILFLLLQLFFCGEVLLSGDREFAQSIAGKGSSFFMQTPIPDLAIFAFATTGILLLFQRRKANVYFKTAFLGALLLVAFAQHFFQVAAAVPLFYTGAGLIIILAVIQDYYLKAYIDELTGLPARRSLNEAMQKLEGVYTIAMVDVDFFKKFNDTYGHDAGDDVLRLIAGVMKECQKARFFRYGGEEFTVLFPGKKLADAIPILEEVREEIAKRKFVVRAGKTKSGERKVNVTVSMGAAQAVPGKDKPEMVIKAADTALYRAKEGGRNCVCQ